MGWFSCAEEKELKNDKKEEDGGEAQGHFLQIHGEPAGKLLTHILRSKDIGDRKGGVGDLGGLEAQAQQKDGQDGSDAEKGH